MGDDTRNLISNAEALLDKHSDPSDPVRQAEALLNKKGGQPPSTKQLLVDAEKLIAKRKAKGPSPTIVVLLAAAVLAGVAIVWVLLRGG